MWGKETRKCKFMTLLSKRLAWVLGHSKVLFTVLLITSLYAILVIELEALPPMKINRSEEFVKGLNRIFLGLSYSYVVGIIVFWFTVIWPARHEKYRLRPVINKKIENIGTMLEYMITGFPLKEGQSFVDLKDLEGCRNLLKSADWNKKNALWTYPDGRNQLYQTFFDDFRNIQSYITEFLSCYKQQLDIGQMLYLEAFNNAQFMTALKVFVDVQTGIKFPEKGADFIIEEFIDILKGYNKLREEMEVSLNCS